MSKCTDCNELVGEEWSANNGLCSACTRDELSKPDTNQASEDELRAEILTEFKQVHRLAPVDYTENCTNVVMSIIRTEKLKLLAEVRERVVGEHKPKTRGLTQNPNNAAYWTKASQAEFDLIEEQLAELDKLEAEL